MRLPVIMSFLCFARIASAASVPNFDITEDCKSTMYIEKSQLDHCIESEQKAHDLLPQLIDSIPIDDIDRCISNVSRNNVGSYVGLVVCIELNEHFGKDNPRNSVQTNPPAMPTSIQTTRAQNQSEKNKHPSPAGGAGHAYSEPASPTVRPPVDPIVTGRINQQTRAIKFRFDRDLGIGSVGPDVKELQILLNTKGFRVAESGPGSPGHEVDIFDTGTRAALIEFQMAHAPQILAPFGFTKATGIFGNTTRKYVNASSHGRVTGRDFGAM